MFELKTSKVTFKRNNKEIVFLGTSHLGTNNYYTNLNYELNSFKPNQVIFESVKTKTKPKLNEIILKYGKLLGLSYQSEVIKNNEDWVWGDLDEDTLNNINGESIFKKYENIDINNTKELDDLILKYKNGFMFFISIVLYFHIKFGKNNPVIETIRNYNLILKTFEVLKTEDKVCIFFGEAHLNQISKYFKSIGFKKIKIESFKPF